MATTTSPSRSVASASASLADPVRFVAAPAAGDVARIVRDAKAQVEASRGRLLVYVGARWCEPCQRFHHAAERGELDALLPGLTFLEFDLDRDGERLASAGYASQYIPLFASPRADGSASGKQVEGGIKGEGAVPYITARVQTLVQ